MAFIDYTSELVGTVPKLPPLLAEKYVNRAWKEIRDLRLWSFLLNYGDLVAPAVISAGYVSATFGSTSITCDATASPALAAVVAANPPLASATLGVGRQIKVGTNSPIYNIVAVNTSVPTAVVLTLDRAYSGATGSSLAYSVFRSYFAPPAADFVRYWSLTNARSNYTIQGKRLYVSQDRLSAIDPQRASVGDAYQVSPFRVDSTGHPVYELYPTPTNPSVYNCLYQRRGTDLSSTVDLPATFPDSVLIDRALMHAAEWAHANVTTVPELGQTNWVMFLQAKKTSFREGLIQAIKQDDEMMPIKAFQMQFGGLDFPLGGEFVQGHDISRILP